MTNGVVTHWPENTPPPPFVTIAASLLCVFALLLYSAVDPIVQQAMIDLGGMRPSTLSVQLRQGFAAWWSLSSLTLVSALFIHANWLHLLGNLVYLWVN